MEAAAQSPKSRDNKTQKDKRFSFNRMASAFESISEFKSNSSTIPNEESDLSTELSNSTPSVHELVQALHIIRK